MIYVWKLTKRTFCYAKLSAGTNYTRSTYIVCTKVYKMNIIQNEIDERDRTVERMIDECHVVRSVYTQTA